MSKKVAIRLMIFAIVVAIIVGIISVAENSIISKVISEEGSKEDTIFNITLSIAVISFVMSFLSFFFKVELSGSRIIQIFESRLFLLIQNHENIRDRIELKDLVGLHKGHYALASILYQINIDCENLNSMYGKKIEHLIEAYRVNYNSLDYFKKSGSFKDYFEKKGLKNNYKYILHTYFDSLFSIFHHINNETGIFKDSSKREFYANIVKNNLYIDELALLYYHCVSEVDMDWYKKNYIEIFRILSPLPKHYPLVQNYPPIIGLKNICHNIEEDHEVEEYFVPVRKW